ncbi:MAG: FtsX-like permease family protein [Chlorobium sp.]|uniref:ABC transporter permease n=1 Tax=Chlorobium sp. TaxID=1095 RepID=UPI0025C5FDC9|nr:FtsX-like permease family protein [Chlorobium sp.]MCF8382426.1 FtsX-like permease family protein [Chlorobium sp.]
MKTALWIARRFSFARKRFRIINVISAISLAGIIVGVSTLLIVMSVLNGFQRLAYDMFTTIEGEVQLVSRTGSQGVAVSDSLLQSLAAVEGVAAAEPFAEGEAIMSAGDGGKSELVMIRGLSRGAQRELMRRTSSVRPFFSEETVSAGDLLAGRLGLSPFSEVRLFSPELISVGLEMLSEPYMLAALRIPETKVSSTFTLQKLFDDRYVLAPNEFARKVLLLGGQSYTGIDIRAEKGVSGRKLLRRLEAKIAGTPFAQSCTLRSLEKKYGDIFAVMQLEKWASFSVLMLVVLVAALSLTGSLAMTAIDKQKELFYLRCLGLERPQFMGIFLIQGTMTGLAGTAIGSLAAWGICRLQELYGIVRLPSQSAFIIQSYPVSMNAADFLAVGLTAVALSVLVSIYPARKAAAIAVSHSLDKKTN